MGEGSGSALDRWPLSHVSLHEAGSAHKAGSALDEQVLHFARDTGRVHVDRLLPAQKHNQIRYCIAHLHRLEYSSVC